jgi:hypothetical protein
LLVNAAVAIRAIVATGSYESQFPPAGLFEEVGLALSLAEFHALLSEDAVLRRLDVAQENQLV